MAHGCGREGLRGGQFLAIFMVRKEEEFGGKLITREKVIYIYDRE
jgi:hypothetical protein